MAAPYITIAELEAFGINSAALRGITAEQKTQCILIASSELEDIAGTRFTMPFATVTVAMKMHVARAASYHLLFGRGFCPDGDNQLIRMGYEDALKYFKSIATGAVAPSPAVVSPAPIESPELTSDESRGYDSETV
jgi:phage gp36-like protein